MERSAQEVFDRLKQHGRNHLAVIEDQQLNELLDPFRGVDPLPARCGQPGCKRVIRYWALHPHLPLVVSWRSGPRKPEVRKHMKPPHHLGVQPPPPFDNWSVGTWPQPWEGRVGPLKDYPWGGRDLGTPTDSEVPGVKHLAGILKCPRRRCGATYPVDNTRMLRLLVLAIARGQRDIVLPHGFESRLS